MGQVTSRKVSYIVGGRIVLSGEKDVLLEKWRLVSFSLKNPAALEQVRRLLPYVKTRGREGRKVEGATGDFSPRLPGTLLSPDRQDPARLPAPAHNPGKRQRSR